MSYIIRDGASLLKSSTSRVVLPDWHELVDWTHCWDAKNAVMYQDDGTDWSISPATRVDFVEDRGLGTHPLKRDEGAWSSLFGDPTYPGHLLVRSSARFNGRPATVSDSLGPGAFGTAWSMLAPNTDPANSADWFNAPSGIAVPYWCAVLARPQSGLGGAWDAMQGGVGTTVSIIGDFNSTGLWGVTNSLGLGDPWPSSTVLRSAQKTVFIVVSCNTTSSFIEISQRDSSGVLSTTRNTFTLANRTAKELFIGWISGHAYFSAGGIKSGAPTEPEITAVRRWAAQFIPAAGTLAVEP